MINPILIAVLFCHLPPFADYRREWDGHANGVYWKNDVFVALPKRPLPKWKLRFGKSPVKYASDLFRTSPYCDERPFSSPIKYSVYGVIGADFRFSISGGFAQFYAGSQNLYFPIEDFPLLEITGLGKELFDLKYNPQRESSSQSIPFLSDTEPLLTPGHREWDLPQAEWRRRLMEDGWSPTRDTSRDMGHIRREYADRVRCDTLPIDAFRLRLFQVLDGRLLISTEPVPLRFPKESLALGKKPAPIPERDLKSGKLPAGFKGRFHAYAVGDRHYLLTAGGKLYKCAAKGEDGLEVTEVWSDPARPLIGVVDCPDTKQAFAFGWGSKPGDTGRYWVEFGDKPAPTAYILRAKLKGDREDAFREVNGCVAALQAMKAVRPALKPEGVRKVKKE